MPQDIRKMRLEQPEKYAEYLAQQRERANNLKHVNPEQYAKRLADCRARRKSGKNKKTGKSRPVYFNQRKPGEPQDFAPFKIPEDELEAWNRARDRWL